VSIFPQAATQSELQSELIGQLHASLQKLVGYHRQLMDAVRMERDALVQAELRAIRETTCAKQCLVESIRIEEAVRVRVVSELALLWKRPSAQLLLNQIIIEIQVTDPKGADQLRSALNALTILVKRVMELNDENARFVAHSLEHITNMKRNVLGENTTSSQTYTQQGTRTHTAGASRHISKEA
jgi:hypothetical protein